ncbi:DUF4386 domain-containing protein [Microbacterium aurantiacum]|uniref:DUF4386 domain-containing protein n=1 Tax=Microbacterium aurantiacum TaxID=162393 RepID=UPI001F1DE0DE|nr:DUF4386 domain-containing protein [Microbacterium aurantiacum]
MTAVTAVIAYGDAGGIRLGVALELVLALGCLGTGVLLWHLLRSYGPVRAASFGALRLMEAAVIGAATLPMLAIALTGSFGQPLGDALVEVHRAGFLIGQGMIISVNTIILGWLLLDARVGPRALAFLAVAGGVIVLIGHGLQLFGVIEMGVPIAGLTAVPIFVFEIWFAVYLLVRGLRRRDPVTDARSVAARA